jgi:hypothetical protein
MIWEDWLGWDLNFLCLFFGGRAVILVLVLLIYRSQILLFVIGYAVDLGILSFRGLFREILYWVSRLKTRFLLEKALVEMTIYPSCGLLILRIEKLL